jgi:cysteine desulfuration protein SufE
MLYKVRNRGNKMAIDQRISKLVEDFNNLEGWEDKYLLIIKKGKELPSMNDEYKIDANKVKGCQSQVWIHASLKDNSIIFEADSDASIVKGIISILLEVYSTSTPEEILSTPPNFLEDIGLKQNLSMSRANGLSFMIKQISLYALAFKTKLELGQ